MNYKKDFPIFNNNKLIYLDSAATSQRPAVVINALSNFYEKHNSNIHRAIYKIGEEATEMYELTREKVAKFINASKDEIIFTRNTTESVNLAVYSYFSNVITSKDTILLTEMEHHSNLVPWQLLAKKKNAKLDYLKIDNNGKLNLNELKEKLSTGKVKVLAICHASNVLGTINPIKEISKLTKKYNTILFVDGAQAIPHMKVDIKELNCDFYAFSAHKMLGPFGVGILYARKELNKDMQVFETGGGTIKEVTKQNTVFLDSLERFEAGTQNIADIVAFGTALDYLNKVGMNNIRKHEITLIKYALEKLSEIKNLEIYGPRNANERTGVISFNLKGIHPHDIATILDNYNIAIRAGHHCTMILHKKLNVIASARVSFYIYNTKEDVDKLVKSLLEAKKVFEK
ncbi:MAG: SufS family cysteine desulfurase [Nanoarchaeota archaeon]